MSPVARLRYMTVMMPVAIHFLLVYDYYDRERCPHEPRRPPAFRVPSFGSDLGLGARLAFRLGLGD